MSDVCHRSSTAHHGVDIAETMSRLDDDNDPARLKAVAEEIDEHEHQGLAEMDGREQAVIDEARAQELAATDAFEASGYWQSGYRDSVTGETHEFDHKQDYEDALGQIVSPIYHDLWEDAGTLAQQDGARMIVENANDGDPVEIDLGHRHYFVREVGAKESNSYGPDAITSLWGLRQDAERLHAQDGQSDEYFDAQLKYEQRVDAALSDPRLTDADRSRIISEHYDAVSGVWLDAHPQFQESHDIAEIRERQRKAQDQGEGYGY
jgi:hypothetical protein